MAKTKVKLKPGLCFPGTNPRNNFTGTFLKARLFDNTAVFSLVY
jgi:hypothetical protein